MHIKFKRSLGLILLAGLLLAALLQVLSPQTGPTFNIAPRRGGTLKEFIYRKNQNILSSYPDIPYHTKESVARCAAQEPVSLNSCSSLNSRVHFTCLIPLPDTACYLITRVRVWLTRRAFIFLFPIICTPASGPTVLGVPSWSLSPTLKKPNVTELKSIASTKIGHSHTHTQTLHLLSVCNY